MINEQINPSILAVIIKQHANILKWLIEMTYGIWYFWYLTRNMMPCEKTQETALQNHKQDDAL